MAMAHVNPTRMELKKLKGRLTTARRGHKLLKDKRDELMRRFLLAVRENKELRERVEAELDAINRSFSAAAATTDPRFLREALAIPKKRAELKVSYANTMSVTVPVFQADILSTGAEGEPGYGLAFTSGELDEAVAALSRLLPDLILLAEREKTALLLAEEIERTRRRVNALEYIMIPQYETEIKRISMKLDENERGNTTRLMKLKDLILVDR